MKTLLRAAALPAHAESQGLPLIGIAAGLVAFLLFGILYVLTDSLAALVAGCGGALLLLCVSIAAAKRAL